MTGETKPRNKRWRVTSAETSFLEAVFHRTRKPSRATIEHLASSLVVRPRQVQVWFQNRRQRWRKEFSTAPGSPTDCAGSSMVDCDTVHPSALDAIMRQFLNVPTNRKVSARRASDDGLDGDEEGDLDNEGDVAGDYASPAGLGSSDDEAADPDTDCAWQRLSRAFGRKRPRAEGEGDDAEEEASYLENLALLIDGGPDDSAEDDASSKTTPLARYSSQAAVGGGAAGGGAGAEPDDGPHGWLASDWLLLPQPDELAHASLTGAHGALRSLVSPELAAAISPATCAHPAAQDEMFALQQQLQLLDKGAYASFKSDELTAATSAFLDSPAAAHAYASATCSGPEPQGGWHKALGGRGGGGAAVRLRATGHSEADSEAVCKLEAELQPRPPPSAGAQGPQPSEAAAEWRTPALHTTPAPPPPHLPHSLSASGNSSLCQSSLAALGLGSETLCSVLACSGADELELVLSSGVRGLTEQWQCPSHLDWSGAAAAAGAGAADVSGALGSLSETQHTAANALEIASYLDCVCAVLAI